jgi:hypothetical protein
MSYRELCEIEHNTKCQNNATTTLELR